MSRKEKVDTSGGGGLSQNPFAALEGGNGTSTPPAAGTRAERRAAKKPAKRLFEKAIIRREKKGRGGKTVTTVELRGLHNAVERERWARDLRNRLGVGGSLKNDRIELQGDQSAKLFDIFAENGIPASSSG